MNPRPFSFGSLFCGCGGLDLGFEQAGFKCLSALDNDIAAVTHHRRNLNSTARVGDVTDLKVAAQLMKGVDVLVAGPPCQGFSTLGKRNIDDPRNNLLLVPAKLAVAIRPKVVLIENVAGAASGAHRRYWQELDDMLREGGYRTMELLCHTEFMGVAQKRRRLMRLAWSTNKEPAPLTPNIALTTLRKAFARIENTPNHEPLFPSSISKVAQIAKHIAPGQKLSNVRVSDNSIHTWHIPEVFGRTTRQERDFLNDFIHIRRRNRTRDHGDADPVSLRQLNSEFGAATTSLLKSLLAKKYIRQKNSGYDLTNTFNGKCRRLLMNEPSPTVDTRFGDAWYFLHPKYDRGLTVREAARIQGFPDWFIFEGPLRSQYRMIGNAVPPPVARMIANFIADELLS